MWKKIKRILKNALLFPVLVAFAKGTYEEGDPPELLTTDYSEPYMDWLMDLLDKDVTLPTVDIPGLSDQEKKLVDFGSSIIEKMMGAGTPEPFTLGMDKIKSILGGEYDPTKGDYYEGLKEETARIEEKGISDIRQRSQLGGMLYSEPAMGAEADYKGILGTGLTKELGRLFESNANREASMIPQLLNYAGYESSLPGQQIETLKGFAPMAGQERDIATKQALADWEVATNQELFPFQYQAPIAEYTADWGNWYQPEKTYQPGLFDYLGGIGSILGLFF